MTPPHPSKRDIYDSTNQKAIGYPVIFERSVTVHQRQYASKMLFWEVQQIALCEMNTKVNVSQIPPFRPHVFGSTQENEPISDKSSILAKTVEPPAA